MTSSLKKIIATCSAVAIFFFLASALCPIEAMAVPKAKARTQKQVKQAPPREEPAEEETAQPVAREAEAPAAAAEEKSAQAPGAAGGANANGFNLDNYRDDEAETESYGWLIFKTIFVIGLLVGGFYYFFRFVTKKVGIQMLGRDAVQVLSVVPIGQNKYLQVVDLAGRVLVLGVTDSNINFITEIVGKDEIDRIRLMSSRPVARDAAPFQEFLAKQLGKIVGKKGTVVEPEMRESRETRPFGDTDRLDYLKRQRERLKRINGTDNES